MIWVPPLGFDTYLRGKLLPLQNEFTPSVKSKKKFQKVWTNFEKSKKPNFLENCLTDPND